jgi:chromosome segregation ATPase
MAKTSKSPFLILDEIDSFLDNENVQRFVRLISEAINGNNITNLGSKFQFVVITHKKSLFLSGKSLVGTNKPK